MNRRTYETALSQAESELQSIIDLIDRLRARKEKTEGAISALRAVLETQSTEAFDSDISARAGVPDAAVPASTREMVISVLKRAGYPLTVSEIHEKIRLSGALLVPERDAIRVMMARRKDIFQALGKGRYELVRGSEEASPQSDEPQEEFSLQ